MTGTRAYGTGLWALGLCVAAAWMIQHPYWGITHDSILYTLLALARIHPDTLTADTFLRFGSQDRFTLFSPVYAFMIRHFDLSAAAATLTLVSELALYGCAWLLASRFMSASMALLATGLLIALPGYYGSGHLFSYSEDFLTPRLAAGALSLAALAAALRMHNRSALGCVVAAFLLHPLIALACAMLLLVILVGVPRPAWTTVAAGGVLSVTLAAAALVPAGPFARFDSEWLAVTAEQIPYLFVTGWFFDDWVRLAVTLNVLALGLLCSRPPMLRAVCGSAIVTAVAGIVLTALFCDWLHTILPTQMQTWRFVWISSALAVLLSPIIATENWSSGCVFRRAALIFLAGSLLLRADSGAAFGAAFSLGAAATARWRPQFAYGRPVFLGACGFFLLAFALTVAEGVPSSTFIAGSLIAVWWLQRALQPSTWKVAAVAAAAAVVCSAVLPGGLSSWTRAAYTPELQASFAPWRARLPARAQILWPERPVDVWYLLDRASYWSRPQLAGGVFSRTAALELDRRTQLLRAALLSSAAFKNSDSVTRVRHWIPLTLESLDAQGLSVLCTDPALGYVVSRRRMGVSSMPPVSENPARSSGQLYIYDCKDIRGS